MRLLLLIILLLATSAVLRAQSFFSRDYWLSEQNAQQRVTALAQDAGGYLYLATDAGIYRFNGRGFLLLADSIHKPVTTLTAAGRAVYAGYANGIIAHISGDNIYPLHWHGPRPSAAITSLAVHWGVLFASTEAEGFFAIAGGYSRQIDVAAGLSDNFVYALSFPGDSTIVAATDQGLSQIDFQRSGRIAIKRGVPSTALPDNIVRVLRPVPGYARCQWGGMQDSGLFLYNVNHDSPAGMVSRLSKDWHWGQINDIMPLSDNHAWVITERGYLLECFYKPGNGYVITPHLYEGRKLYKLLQDASGNIWCATSAGITLITDNYLRFRQMDGDYSLQNIAAMCFDKRDNLWYSLGQNLYRMTLGNSPEKIFTAPAPITAIYPDEDGRVWMGTLGAGLLCRTGSGFQDLVNINGIIDKNVLNISGRGRSVWVSSLNGVEEIETDGGDLSDFRIVRHHGKTSGAGSDYVYQTFPDSRGRIWFATDGAGVTMWDGKRYYAWDKKSGFDSKVVYSITEDRRGHIWAASLEKGLYEWDGRQWQQLGEACGLQDAHISAIAGTGSGQLIITHSKGLDQWYPDSRNFRHYNHKSGLGIDSESNTLNCCATDSRGNVWMPFEHGFVQFPALPAPYRIKPDITIDGVALNQHSLEDGRQNFAADENYVSFRYEAISFTDPEKLFYRYRLEGYDRDWIATSDEQVTFSRLPPGDYNFLVQAALDPAFDGASETSFGFHIATPLWRKPWMIALMLLVAGTGIFLLLRLRERQRQRLAALYQARLIAEYEQLKSQINPHFLFNSLNTLVSLIEESPQSAVAYTTELSDLYRNMLAYRDRDTILLGEELELLRKYFFILKNRFADSIYLDARIPEELLTRKHIVPLSLQMLVENAVKHNVVAPSRPLCIIVEASESSISVRHLIQSKLSKEKGAGLGLANIRNRYALLTKRPMTFGISSTEYLVTLPLL